MSGNQGRLRRWVCTVLVVVFPCALIAQDAQTPGAMLEARGAVTVNGRNVTSQAVFPGDLMVAQAGAGASLTLDGTSVILASDSAARYDANAVVLERGTVSIRTSRGFALHVGCLSIDPAAGQPAEFAVTDSEEGTVTIHVQLGSVGVGEAGKVATLQAGQEVRRPLCVKESARRKQGGAVTAASTGILNSTGALIAGSAVVGTVLVLVLVKSDDPISPKNP